jgi:hypothetical protein
VWLAGLAVTLVCFAVTLPWLMAAALIANMAATAVAGQLVSYLAFFALAHGIDVPFSFIDCLITMPPALLIALVPISLGGWGLRGQRNRRCSFRSCSALL